MLLLAIAGIAGVVSSGGRLSDVGLLLSVAGGAVVSSGGRYPSPYVDDWSDVALVGSGVDASAPVAACLAASGRAIFREGTYTMAPGGVQAVVLADASVVTGAGMGRTILQMPSGETGAIFTLGNDCLIRDLTLAGHDESSTLGARAVGGKHRVRYERVEFKDFSTSLQDGGAAVNGVSVVACKFTSNGVGLSISFASRGVVIRDNVFNGNNIALTLQGGPIGGVIDGNLFVSETTAIALNSASRFVIRGNTVLSATTPINIGTATDCEFGQNDTNSNWPALVSGTRNFVQGRLYGNAAPSTGTWQTGDVVWDISPTSGDPAFYQCSAGGSPGTWKDGPDVP
jgi:hypothetical protein